MCNNILFRMDVIVHDVKLGISQQVSKTSTGDYPSFSSQYCSVNDNLEFVFESRAALVPGNPGEGSMSSVYFVRLTCIGDQASGDSDGDLVCDGKTTVSESSITSLTFGNMVVPDLDVCDTDPSKSSPDGCPCGSTDGDSDGICSPSDLCFGTSSSDCALHYMFSWLKIVANNPLSMYRNFICLHETVDSDGVCLDEDDCPGGDDKTDTDSDAVPDACDACIGRNEAGRIQGMVSVYTLRHYPVQLRLLYVTVFT